MRSLLERKSTAGHVTNFIDAVSGPTLGKLQHPSPHFPIEIGSRIASLGALFAALEEMSRLSDTDESSIQAWRIRRTALPLFQGRAAGIFHVVMSEPNYRLTVVLRVVTAAGVMVCPYRSIGRTTCLVGLSILQLLKGYRSSYGSDGSDQMTFIVIASSALESICPKEYSTAVMINGFISFQSMLSYMTSGMAKWKSPSWRSGDALDDVLRTQTYGDADLYKVFRRSRRVAKWLARLVFVSETTLPLLILGSRKSRLLAMSTGFIFHIGVAKFMGLNRFVWAFCSTYPSLNFSSKLVRRKLGFKAP